MAVAVGMDNPRVSLRLDLYQPAGDRALRRPALIWVHGGGLQGGDKTDEVTVAMATWFARLGYVSAAIDYRTLAPAAGCDTGVISPGCFDAARDAADDAKAAVRWLRAHATAYRIDDARADLRRVP